MITYLWKRKTGKPVFKQWCKRGVFTCVFFLNVTLSQAGEITEKEPASVNRNDWQTVLDEVNREAGLANKQTDYSKSTARDDKKRLTAELKQLQKKAAEYDRQVDTLRKGFKQLLQVEEKLNAEIETENQEIKAVEGIVRTSSKEAESLLLRGHVFAEIPDKSELLSKLAEPGYFPELSDIINLADLYFQHIKTSGGITKRDGTIVGAGGKAVPAEILRIGDFSSYYKLKNPDGFLSSTVSNHVGFLKPDAKTGKLAAVSGSLSWQDRTAISDFFDDQGDYLPLDISSGAIFRLLEKNNGVWDIVKSGGIVGWIILAIGLVAILLGLERLIRFKKIKSVDEGLFQEIQESAVIGDIDKSRELCRAHSNLPTCRVLESVLPYHKSDKEILENSLQESVFKEMPKLERFLSTFSILAAIAPLLGLLGTVTGMITTFQVISTFGTGDPKMMSGGISEALITTQLGLSVAIPIMLYHHFLERRVDKILGDMEERGASLIIALMERNFQNKQTVMDNVA